MSKLDIYLLDNMNNIKESINIIKPLTYPDLLNKIEQDFKNIHKIYEIFIIDKNDKEIKINDDKQFNMIDDILLIRNISKIKSKVHISDNFDLIDKKKEYKLYTNMNNVMNMIKNKKIKEFNLIKKKQNMLIKKYETYIERSMEIFKNIINQMNSIHSLLNLKKNNKLNDLMNIYPLNFDTLYNNLSNAINEEFKQLKNYLINNNINKNNYFETEIKCINDNSSSINSIDISSLNYPRNVQINFNQMKVNLIKAKIEEYKNRINIVYFATSKGNYDIFGEEFAINNKDNIELIINDKPKILISNCELKKGENNITIIIKNKLSNISHMFSGCDTLKDITELKYLDISNAKDFSSMFWGCLSLSDISALENWNVSKVYNFSYMFGGCSLLSDISSLESWNVSNGINFESMFWGCSSLSDIRPLQNWNVFKGKDFSSMFSECISLSDISPVNNWNISKNSNTSNMVWECLSLSKLSTIQN